MQEVLWTVQTALGRAWTAISAQTATRAVVLLLLLEAASWVYVLLYLGTRRKSRIGWLRPTRWALLPCGGFLAVTWVATSVPGTPGSAMRVSTVIGGVLLFVAGWIVRYAGALARYSRPLGSGPRRSVIWLLGRASLLLPAVRHPRYLGLLIEAAGLAVVASSGWALALVGILTAATWLAVEGEERTFVRSHPEAGWQRWREQTRALWPGLAEICQIVGPPMGLGMVAAIWLGELRLATTSELGSLVQALITVQAIVGLLPLTFAIALAQVAASNYSTRIVHLLALDRRAWLALILLLSSLALDILILARPSLVGPYALADLAMVLALMATLVSLWATKELARAVAPERVMESVVDRLDSGWAAAVSEIYSPLSSRPTRVYLGDPFDPVERLLARWGEQDDAGAFRAGLGLVSRQVNRILSRQQVDDDLEYQGLRAQDEAAIDTYLAHYLGPLLGSSARRRRAWVLEELLEFRWSLEPQVTRWVREPDQPGRRTGYPEDAPITLAAPALRGTPFCTRLYAKVLTEAIDNDLDEVGATAAYRLGGLIRRAVSHLPQEESIPRLMIIRRASAVDVASNAEGDADGTEDLVQNDQFLECLEQGLIGYAGDRGADAARCGLPKTAGALALVLSSCVKDIHTRVEGVVLCRVLLQATLHSLDSVARASAEQRVQGVTKFPGLYASLMPGIPQDRELAQMLAYYGASIIERAARNGLLDYGLIIDVSMTALSMVQSYPDDTGRLVLALHRAAETVRSLRLEDPQEEDGDWLCREIYMRIAQIRGSAGGARLALDKALGGIPPKDLSAEELRQALVRAGSVEPGSVRGRRGQRPPGVVGLLGGLRRVLRLLLRGARCST